MRKKLSLTSKIFIAMGMGLAVGILVRSLPAGSVKDTIIIGGVFKVLGQGFISAIKMLSSTSFCINYLWGGVFK